MAAMGRHRFGSGRLSHGLIVSGSMAYSSYETTQKNKVSGVRFQVSG